MAAAVHWAHRLGAPCSRKAVWHPRRPDRLFDPRRRERSPRRQRVSRPRAGHRARFAARRRTYDRVGSRRRAVRSRHRAASGGARLPHAAARAAKSVMPISIARSVSPHSHNCAISRVRTSISLIPVARRLRAAPGFELFAVDVEPIQKFAGVQSSPRLPARPVPIGPRGGEMPKHRPRTSRRRARCLPLRRRRHDARYRQAPCAASRQQLRRLSSGSRRWHRPTAASPAFGAAGEFRAEGEIGQQHALALSERCRSLRRQEARSARSRQAGEATSAPASQSRSPKLRPMAFVTSHGTNLTKSRRMKMRPSRSIAQFNGIITAQ